jgi:hypothetical protein
MLNKIRNSVVGFGLLAVVLAGWLYLFNPTGAEDRGDKALVILKVWWEPVRRTAPLDIAYTLNGRPRYHGKPNESPWHEQLHVDRGTIVALGAMQSLNFDPSSLHCSATANGNTVSGQGICAVMVTA